MTVKPLPQRRGAPPRSYADFIEDAREFAEQHGLRWDIPIAM